MNRLYNVNGFEVTSQEMAEAWLEKQTRQELKNRQVARAKKYGISARDDGALTIPKRFADMGATEADFADPVNFKFPVWLTETTESISDEKLGMVRNAMVRFSQFSAGYDTVSRGKVKERIDSARKKFGVGEFAKAEVAEHEVKVIKAVEEKQLVYGEVLVPDQVDSQKDTVTAEEIEKAAHDYMINSRLIDRQHQETLGPDKAIPVESYIAPTYMNLNGQTISQGTWVMTVKVFDNDLWQAIKSGDFTGFSIRGRGLRAENA